MTSEQARELVSRFLKSFPSLNLASPEVYMLELAVLLCGYPLWAGAAALERAKDEFRYPPARADLRPLLEDQVRYTREQKPEDTAQFAGRTYRGIPVQDLAWKGQPLSPRQIQQLLDREAFDAGVRSDPDRPRYAELKARYGDNFGIGNSVKESPARINARWSQQVQSWDQIRDFYEKHPDRWNTLVRPREPGLK